MKFTVSIEKYNLDLKTFLKDWALNFGVNNNERIILINLICYITQELRKSSPTILVIDVLTKVIKDEDVGQGLEEFLIKLSFYCESLLEGQQQPFSNLGYQSTQEKILKIREITNNFLPF